MPIANGGRPDAVSVIGGRPRVAGWRRPRNASGNGIKRMNTDVLDGSGIAGSWPVADLVESRTAGRVIVSETAPVATFQDDCRNAA